MCSAQATRVQAHVPELCLDSQILCVEFWWLLSHPPTSTEPTCRPVTSLYLHPKVPSLFLLFTSVAENDVLQLFSHWQLHILFYKHLVDLRCNWWERNWLWNWGGERNLHSVLITWKFYPPPVEVKFVYWWCNDVNISFWFVSTALASSENKAGKMLTFCFYPLKLSLSMISGLFWRGAGELANPTPIFALQLITYLFTLNKLSRNRKFYIIIRL